MITKNYDLILWCCNHTSRFPRNHRFVLGERIERNLYGLLEMLIGAKYTKNRQRLLEDANMALEILRFQIQLAKNLHCLKVESYASAAARVGFDAIGPRIISWIGHARHADTSRLPTDLFRRMNLSRGATKPMSPVGRDVQQSTGGRPLG